MGKVILASLLLSLFACHKKQEGVSKDHVTYVPINYPESNFTSVQGVRGVLDTENVYIAGTFTKPNDSTTYGFIYEGPLNDSDDIGTWYPLEYTTTQFNDVTLTSCYGPNNGPKETIQVVGSYKRNSTGHKNFGFLYEGRVNGDGTWTTIEPGGTNKDDVFDVFVHSTMGGLAVGNYDFEGYPASGFSFIYDIENRTDFTYMVDKSYTTTLYGIWHNGDAEYTLAGGFSSDETLSQAFLVDYNHKARQFSNFQAYNYKNDPRSSIITHFEGITASTDGGYNMPADWVSIEGTKQGASFVSVKRLQNGSFSEAVWKDISYPEAATTSANTAYRNNILGVYVTKDTISNTSVTSSYNAKLKLQ